MQLADHMKIHGMVNYSEAVVVSLAPSKNVVSTTMQS